MLLIECLDERTDTDSQEPSSTKPIQVFASDVDEAAIAIARAGVYPSSIASDVSQERLERFFIKADDAHYQIGKQLRDSIVFSRQNVINDAPFSKLDLISCRNLLIYLEPEMQQRVLSLFHFALADDGLLVLGPAESLAQADDLFKPISKKWRIFQKVRVEPAQPSPFSTGRDTQPAKTPCDAISFDSSASGIQGTGRESSHQPLRTGNGTDQSPL